MLERSQAQTGERWWVWSVSRRSSVPKAGRTRPGAVMGPVAPAGTVKLPFGPIQIQPPLTGLTEASIRP